MLGPGDLGAVRGVHHGVQVGGQVADPGADRLQLGGAAAAGRLGLGPPGQGLVHRLLGRLDRVPRAQRDGPGHGGLGGPPLAALGRALAGGALGGRGRGQGLGAAADRPQPLLRGPDLEPGLHLGVARRGAALGEVLAGRLVLRLVRLVGIVQLLGLGELCAELLQPGQVLLGRLPGRGDGGVEPRGLLARGTGRAGQPAKPAGDLGRGRVDLVPAGQRLRHGLPRVLLGLGRHRQLAGRLVAPQLGLGQARGRLVGGGPHLEQALRPGAAALRPVGPEQVTVPGHGLTGQDFPERTGVPAPGPRSPPRRREAPPRPPPARRARAPAR